MTVYHPTSCTECEALKLGDCATCDMSKWRTIQNALAWLIGIEMIGAICVGVFYFIWTGSALDSMMKFGDPFYVAKVGTAVTFVGLVLLYSLREKITHYMEIWSVSAQEWQRRNREEDEDDEDDE